MPDFFEVVHTQRAARTFLPDDVDDATVARILTAATHAPSAENSQPFVFVVVRDPAARAAIGELTARLWQGGAGELEAGRLSPGFWRDVDRGAMGGVAGGARARRGVWGHAPDLPAVHGRLRLPGRAEPAAGRPRARARLHLTTLPVVGGDELGRLLDLPPEVVPVAVVPAGPPARSARTAAAPAHLREGLPRPLRHAVPLSTPADPIVMKGG